MKITILGATGLVGKKLVELALSEGHNITILIRHPEKLPDLPERVNYVVGDYFDASSIAKAIKGSEAVISTIGPAPQFRPTVTPEQYAIAMRQLTEQMTKAGINRFVHLASAGTRLPDEPVNFKRAAMRKLISFVAPIVIPAKELELEILTQSELNWTSIRPPLITDKVSGQLYVSSSGTQGWRVDNTQLCKLILKQINSTEWIKAAPFVGTH